MRDQWARVFLHFLKTPLVRCRHLRFVLQIKLCPEVLNQWSPGLVRVFLGWWGGVVGGGGWGLFTFEWTVSGALGAGSQINTSI